MNLCEVCKKKIGTEVHHLQHQKNADKDGFIKGGDGAIFNKNNLANLLTLCEDCHHSFHKKESKITKKVKTSNGYQIQEI
jgi:5-methylcytosine-specific restriction endonuclease McrA